MLVLSAQPGPSRLGSSGVKSAASHPSSPPLPPPAGEMSASCLDLQTSSPVSAPLELDSDCLEPRGGPGPQQPGGCQGHAGSGGLGTALEEELALIAGERGGEEEPPDPEAPALGRSADLLVLFRQKEKDLVLAAKLGKALLERNQDLTKQYEKMHKDLTDKLEVNKNLFVWIFN